MQYTLKNNWLSATINLKGAELCALKDAQGLNYLWHADATYWGRYAPILFPLVGKVREGVYNYNGKTYQIGQHGFARDMTFVLLHDSETSLTFRLIANETTKLLYPFDFILDVIYTLDEATLSITYQVTNTDTDSIVFKLGAHPGFMCPLFEGETMEDYYLEFECMEKAPLLMLSPEGLFSHDTQLFEGQTINLTPELFAKDALVFSNLQSRSIALCGKNHNKRLTVTFDKFPFLGIWSPVTRSPFICIEPWFGHADFIDESPLLIEKKELVTLPASEIFSCTHSITLH